MRVLLTGGSGQVGTELRRRAQGVTLLAPPRAELDLEHPASIRAWLDRHAPDAILSVGAYTAVDRAEDEPARAQTVNGDAVGVLAEHAARRDLPLFQLSTDYVFDGTKPSPYVESDATGPTGAYGASKLAGERAAVTAPRHLVLRVSWVFAAHGTNFVRTMLRLGAERDRLRVVDDQVGGPTWAGHIAGALLELLQRTGRGEALPWGIHHYSGAPHVSWCAFARVIMAGAQQRGLLARTTPVDAIATRDFPTRARRPANSRLDGSITGRLLGLRPPDWREGLDAVLDELAQGQRRGA